jgi:hypothetical protein
MTNGSQDTGPEDELAWFYALHAAINRLLLRLHKEAEETRRLLERKDGENGEKRPPRKRRKTQRKSKDGGRSGGGND